MIKKTAAAISLLIMAMLVFNTIAVADEKQPSDEEIMAIYMKYAAPGDNHKIFDAMIGSWDAVARWWGDPAAPPSESKATSECKWILGGRFIQDDVTGEAGGMPFHGLGITGYDNYKKQYIAYWFDEMATSCMTSIGSIDSTGKIITMGGTYEDMVSGKAKKFKSITRIVNNDQHIYEMYDYSDDGKEWKNFEVIYNRKK